MSKKSVEISYGYQVHGVPITGLENLIKFTIINNKRLIVLRYMQMLLDQYAYHNNRDVYPSIKETFEDLCPACAGSGMNDEWDDECDECEGTGIVSRDVSFDQMNSRFILALDEIRRYIGSPLNPNLPDIVNDVRDLMMTSNGLCRQEAFSEKNVDKYNMLANCIKMEYTRRTRRNHNNEDSIGLAIVNTAPICDNK